MPRNWSIKPHTQDVPLGPSWLAGGVRITITAEHPQANGWLLARYSIRAVKIQGGLVGGVAHFAMACLPCPRASPYWREFEETCEQLRKDVREKLALPEDVALPSWRELLESPLEES